jgi:hypothetical protein
MPLGLTETSAATAEAAQVWVGVQASAATEKTVERGSAQSFGVVLRLRQQRQRRAPEARPEAAGIGWGAHLFLQ